MLKANGGNEFSYTGLNTAITTAGGTTLQKYVYWSSSENEPGYAYVFDFEDGYWDTYFEDDDRPVVRACLAF